MTRVITNYYIIKIEFLGIRDVTFKLLNSYLENRQQCMSIDKCKSDVRNISCGVPQGSILCPTIFILYVNDMCNISKFVKCILFADDTNIFMQIAISIDR